MECANGRGLSGRAGSAAGGHLPRDREYGMARAIGAAAGPAGGSSRRRSQPSRGSRPGELFDEARKRTPHSFDLRGRPGQGGRRGCGHLVPCADRVILTRAAVARSASPQTLLTIADHHHEHISLSRSAGEAMEQARAGASAEDLIVVTGSIFLFGEARELLRAVSV